MSFRDFVTNRQYRHRAQTAIKRRVKTHLQKRPSRQYIDKLVRDLLDGSKEEAARKELEMIGAAATPSLCEALNNPGFRDYRRLDSLDIDPLESVLDLLALHAPDQVLQAVLPMATSTSPEARNMAALHLASMGRDETIPVLAKLLEDPDGYVRSYVRNGVDRARSEGRCGRFFRKRMYELLLNQCDQEWEGTVNDAAESVVALDPARAAVDLASHRWLSPSNPYVFQILKACNRANIHLPEECLRRLLDHSWPLAVGKRCYPNEYIAGAALEALSIQIGSRARPLLEKALGSDQPIIQEAAARGLVRLAGLGDPIRFVLNREEKVGFKKLTLPQRIVYCAFLFDAEVCNGGLLQFFCNASGAHTSDTLEALRVLGHSQARDALTAAMEMVGPSVREQNQDKRLAAFEGRFDQLKVAFEPLETEFYRTTGLFKQRMLLYAAQNPKHFR